MAQQLRKANPIGRNEICPCGSGRKFKHCCLIKIRQRNQIEIAAQKAVENPDKVEQDIQK